MTDKVHSSFGVRIIHLIIGVISTAGSFVVLNYPIFLIFYLISDSSSVIEGQSEWPIEYDLLKVVIVISIILLGGIGGITGGRKFFTRKKQITGAIYGGLISSIIIYALLFGVFFGYREHLFNLVNISEMRPKTDHFIPKLYGEHKNLFEVQDSIYTIAVNQSGTQLAFEWNGQIYFWDLVQNKQAGYISKSDLDDISQIDFSPDGRWFVIGDFDGKAKVYSLDNLESAAFTFLGNPERVFSFAINPVTNLMAYSDGYDRIHVVSLSTGKEINNRKIGDSYIPYLEYSPDGSLLAVGQSYPLSILLFDAETLEVIGQMDLTRWKDKYWLNGLQFSPDGTLLAVSMEGGPVLWNVDSMTPIGPVQRIQTFNLTQFSPDGKLMIDALSNGSIIFWEASTRLPIGKVAPPDADISEAIFLPDGRLFVVSRETNNVNSIFDDACGGETFEKTTFGIWTIDLP